MITVEAIQRATASHYGIPFRTMREPIGQRINSWQVSHPRQVAMCLSWRLTRASTTTIGKVFGGRDHTTVIHAIRAVANREVHRDLRAITLQLLSEQGKL